METYNELEPIIKDFVIKKYQDRFGGILNSRVISYVDMITETPVDEDKKKSKLREFNIEILEGGNEKDLQEKIENIDEIVIEETEKGNMWESNILGEKLDTSNTMNIISPQVKMKNLRTLKINVNMGGGYNTMSEDQTIDYLIRSIGGQIHQEFKNIINKIPVTNINKKMGTFTELHKFIVNKRCHPLIYCGSLSFIESIGVKGDTDKFEIMEFLNRDEILFIPEQKKLMFSYLSFTSNISTEMGYPIHHVLNCVIDLIADPKDCVLLKLNNNLI